jgi:hypothetical protein
MSTDEMAHAPNIHVEAKRCAIKASVDLPCADDRLCPAADRLYRLARQLDLLERTLCALCTVPRHRLGDDIIEYVDRTIRFDLLLLFMSGHAISEAEYEDMEAVGIIDLLMGESDDEAGRMRWTFGDRIVERACSEAVGCLTSVCALLAAQCMQRGDALALELPRAAATCLCCGRRPSAARTLAAIADKIKLVEHVRFYLASHPPCTAPSLERDAVLGFGPALRFLAGEAVTPDEYERMRDAGIIAILGGRDRCGTDGIVRWNFERRVVDAVLTAAQRIVGCCE